MRQYLDLLQRIKDEGLVKGDRTGTGTKSIFGHQMKFDLRDGFPMLTTKKLHLRSIIHELLWFLNGDTNNKYLRDNKVRIWNEWSDDNHNLGKIYGYQFRKLYKLDNEQFEIAKKPAPYVDDYVEDFDILDVEPEEGDNYYVGKIFKGHNDVEFKVIRKELIPETSELKEHHETYYKIQFLVSHSVKVVSKSLIDVEGVEDDYYPLFYNRGYYGPIINTDYDNTELSEIAYEQWLRIMDICYNEESVGYEFYGAKGKKVCRRWWNYTNFYNDIQLIHGYYEMMKLPEEYVLSLVEHGGDTFAPDQCMFIYIKKEYILSNDMYKPIYMDDRIRMCADLEELYNYDIEYKEIELKDDEFIRYKVKFVDQIQNCIDLIKNDPGSRRIMVCAWNPEDLDEMNLTPCHCLFQFYVAPDENGKPKWLDLQLYQRSCDTFLGVPFNIASYSLLCMMMAQVCDLEPRYFIHTMGDTHLYLNHLEQADIQLSREPRKLPKMKLNENVKDLFSFKYEDFELSEYDSHPHIKAEVSV